MTGFLVYLLMMVACQARPEVTDAQLVGTELFLPSLDDEKPSLQPILGLFLSQMTDSTVVHLAVPQLTPQLVESLLLGLRRRPGATLYLMTDPISWNQDRSPSMQSVRDSLRTFAHLTGQVALENDRNPRAGWLGRNLTPLPRRMASTVFLANHLARPAGIAEDVVLLFSAEGLADHCSPAAYAVAMDGAPELFAPFLKYVTLMAESQLDYVFNVAPATGPRRAAFLPSPQGDSPLKALIGLFSQAIEQSGKPLKIRAAIPVWDAEHIVVARQLRALRELYESDIRLLLPPEGPLEDTIWKALGPDAREWTREWTSLDQDGYWLIDGPFEKEPGVYQRQSLLLAGQYQLARHSDSLISSILLKLHEATLFQQLESQWEKAWEEKAAVRPLPDSMPLLDSILVD